MTIQEYIIQLNKRYISGISREHSYRGDIETLFRSLLPDVDITNEPANVTLDYQVFLSDKNKGGGRVNR